MRSLAPFGPLIALTALLSIVVAVYGVAGRSPSMPADLLISYSPAVFIILWITADARRRRCVPCYDFGLLVGLFFPVAVIWYAVWTRGWKGIPLVAAFVVMLFLPWVLAVIVWLMVYGWA